MGRLERELLTERTAAVERHLKRVTERLPGDSRELRPMTDAADTVILHLWQAVLIVIDLATAACAHFRLGTPQDYTEAFQRLRRSGYLGSDLATRLARAARLPDLVERDEIEMDWLYRAAQDGPGDLRAFLAALAGRL